MKQRKPYLAAGVFALVAGLVACGQPAAPTVINVNQIQTVTINPGLGGGQPSPSPGASDVKEVRVGIFGQVCPAGVTRPNNSERIIKVGCTASITATPRRADGSDACEPEGTCSASDVTWEVSASAPGVVDVRIPSVNFNRDAVGLGPGKAQFRAKVKGVEGVLDVDVVS